VVSGIKLPFPIIYLEMVSHRTDSFFRRRQSVDSGKRYRLVGINEGRIGLGTLALFFESNTILWILSPFWFVSLRLFGTRPLILSGLRDESGVL
jgi:hypothetical protein